MPRLLADRIVFDEKDWLGGLALDFVGGLVAERGSKLLNASIFDPFRDRGFAVPGLNAETPTNSSVLSGVCVCGVSPDDNKAYLGATDGELHELTTNTHTLTSGGVWPQLISTTAGAGHGGHTTFVAEDMMVYSHKVGGTITRNIFYSWRDNTDWDVGLMTRSGGVFGAFNSDYMSTVPATPLAGADLTDGVSKPHAMATGADGFLYMTSGRYLHAYDGLLGNDGTFESQVFDTKEAGWITSAILVQDRYMLIFAYRPSASSVSPTLTRGDAAVFWWDHVSPTYLRVDDLMDNEVGAPFIWNGIVGCFTSGRTGVGNKPTKLKLYIGGRWKTYAYLTQSIPRNRGVDIFRNKILFNAQAHLYTYGSEFDDVPDQLGHINGVSGSSDVSGICRSFLADQIVAASANSLERFATGYGVTAAIQTSYITPFTEMHLERQIAYVRVYFKSAAAAGGRNLQLDLVADSGNTTMTVFNSDTVAAAELIRDFHWDTSNLRFKPFQNLKANLTWSGGASTGAPAVKRIEVFLKPYKVLKAQ